MKLTGPQVEKFVDILCNAFTRDELSLLTRTALDVDLKAVVPDGSLQSVAFGLVEWAERRGRAVELLRAVRAARPNDLGTVIGFIDPLLGPGGAADPAAGRRDAGAFQMAEMQAASVATRTLADEFAQGRQPTAADVVAIRTRAVEAVASAAVPVPTVADHIVNEIRESIIEVVEEWKGGMASGDPVEWVRAMQRYQSKVCQLLNIAQQMSGGQLPDDLLKLWADNRCG